MRESLKQLAGTFPLDKWPVLECPTCKVGFLTVENDALSTSTLRASLNLLDITGDPTDAFGVFYGYLECNASGCGEIVAVVGDFGWKQDFVDSEVRLERIYRVRMLNPPVRVVEVPKTTPEKVRSTLQRAEGVVWQDPPAGISLLRQSVERLLDDRGIAQRTAKGGFRSLRDRIAEYDSINHDVAELLEAARLVGNSETHIAALTATEFLEIAQIVEVALGMLYTNNTTAAVAHARRIAAARGYVP